LDRHNCLDLRIRIITPLVCRPYAFVSRGVSHVLQKR
jgi:hypothetical protein